MAFSHSCLLAFLLTANMVFRASAAIGPVTGLTIINANISPDGLERPAVLADGKFPGPLITGKKGDTFRINVKNELTDSSMLQSTSIHWHGLFQSGYNWADGTAFVTQCPIAANDSFLYEFTVPDQTGTFWYHSHLATQYCDGLRGPLVIYDDEDPHTSLYDIDDENTIITIGDWYHTIAPLAGVIPVANSTVINGKGRYLDGPDSELSVVSVESGKRYRFRLVSISCEPFYTFSIDGHNITIIEVDGTNVHPYTVDSLQILAGQRYSFVVHADAMVDNYWIRANPQIGSTGFENGMNSAILRYAGAQETAYPSTHQKNYSTAMNEVELRPLAHTSVPGRPEVGGADITLNLDIYPNLTALVFTVNGATYIPPTLPVLLQILSGAKDAQSLLPLGSVYTLPRNKVVELTIPGSDASVGGPHPFHLHGHAFHVVRSAGSQHYNFEDPIVRDVVSTGYVGDNVTIRWVTDNPGPWLMHCHIDWHLEAGLAVVFAEDVNDTATHSPVPEPWKELCPIYYSSTSY